MPNMHGPAYFADNVFQSNAYIPGWGSIDLYGSIPEVGQRVYVGLGDGLAHPSSPYTTYPNGWFRAYVIAREGDDDEAEWVLRFDAAYEDIWNPVVIETVESNLVFEEKFEKIVPNISGMMILKENLEKFEKYVSYIASIKLQKRIEDGEKLRKHFGIDGGGLFWWVNQAASPVANKANMNKTNKANGPCRNLWRTTRTGMSY